MVKLFKKRTDRKFKLKPIKKRPPSTKLGRRIKDPFGNLILLKRALTSIIGIATYRRPKYCQQHDRRRHGNFTRVTSTKCTLCL